MIFPPCYGCDERSPGCKCQKYLVWKAFHVAETRKIKKHMDDGRTLVRSNALQRRAERDQYHKKYGGR